MVLATTGVGGCEGVDVCQRTQEMSFLCTGHLLWDRQLWLSASLINNIGTFSHQAIIKVCSSSITLKNQSSEYTVPPLSIVKFDKLKIAP